MMHKHLKFIELLSAGSMFPLLRELSGSSILLVSMSSTLLQDIVSKGAEQEQEEEEYISLSI